MRFIRYTRTGSGLKPCKQVGFYSSCNGNSSGWIKAEKLTWIYMFLKNSLVSECRTGCRGTGQEGRQGDESNSHSSPGKRRP